MAKSTGRYTSLIVPLVTWLVLLIPFAIYQRYYVTSQVTYLTNHGFRLLAAVGRQLGSYIDSVTITVNGAKRATENQDDPDKVYKRYLNNFLPELSIPPGDLKLSKDHDPSHTFSAVFGPNSHAFRRTFTSVPVSGVVTLDTAIEARLRGIGDDYFDDVLIANSQGDVLYQRSMDRRITNIRELTSEIPKTDTPPAAGGKSDSAPASKATSSSASTRFSNVREVQLAGDDYKLFLQPYRLASGGADVKDNSDDDELMLCGLWRTARLNSDSFALPYSSVIWFGLICIAAGSFLWPFLKINYMARTERLRRTDGWLLIITVFVGTMAGTLMVLNATYYSDSTETIDRDLDALSTQIQSNVEAEFRRAIQQLESLSQSSKFDQLAGKGWNPQTEILANPGYAMDYPYFEIAFWTDLSGQQVVKFSTERESTPRTDVSDRQFFRDVTAPQLRSAPRLAVLGDRQYSVEPRISPNTGQFSTVVATPFRPKTDRPELAIGAAAIVFRPLSLVDPVLPPDFGFAVLNSDGKVLFHSNSLRNLSENFFEECKDPSSIQSAVFSGTPQHLDVDYSGVDRRILVTRIDKLGARPLTLVVFHNKDLNRTIILAMILIVSVFTGVYLLIILVVAALDLLSGAPYPPKMIWPSRENSARYVYVCLYNTVLVLLFALLYSSAWELGLLALTVVTMACGIAGTIFILKVKRAPIAEGTWQWKIKSRFRSTYVLAGVSLVVVATFVPCFGFYKFAHDAVNELAARHGQLTILNRLEDRDSRIRSYFQSIGALEGFPEKRGKESLDRYDSTAMEFLSFNEQKPEKVVEDHPWLDAVQDRFDDWLSWASRLFPSNTLGDEMRMLHFEDSYPWSELGRNKFHVSSGTTSVDSKFQLWTGIGFNGWFWLFAIWSLIGCWLFLLMKKIFVPDRQNPIPPEEVQWKSAAEITADTLVLSEPQFGDVSWLDNIRAQHRLDMCVDQERLKDTEFIDNSIVIIKNFDFRMDSRAHNEIRLQLLERLIYKLQCRVVLISAIDVIYYLSEGDDEVLAENSKAAADALDRWTRVMSGFQIVIYPGDRAVFTEELNRLRENPRLRPLIDWIEHECGHTPFLRRVGLDLLRNHTDSKCDFQTLENELLNRADSYYSLVWVTLSSSERLTLYQLALDGWANTKNDRAIWQLQRKGLIYSSPMFCIANDSFRRFVLKSQDQREIADWEQQGAQSSWRTVKISLIATAVGLAAWMFYAQKDLFQGAMAYILTLGAAITTIANMLGTFRGRAQAAAKPPDS